MNIDYSIILTKKEVEGISQEKYKFIETECNRISQIAEATLSESQIPQTIKRGHYKTVPKDVYAREIVFLKDYKNEDFTVKTLMTSKIIYHNSEMIINILLSKNITYEILTRIINRLDKIKQLAISGNEILDENIMITDKNLNYICAILNKYYHYKNHNYLIAKLIDIVVNEKELYLSLQGEKVKTH